MSDLNPDARRLVDLAREARTPSADDKRRMAMKLALPLATGAAAGGAANAAKAAATTAAKTPLLSGFALKLSALVATGVVATALVVGGRALRSNRLAPAARAAPSQQLAPVTPAPPALVVPETTPEPSATPTEAAAPAAPPKSSAAHVGKAPDDLAQEAELLHRAQTAWRAGQSAEALSLANQHAQRFPRSQLANERDVLRVLSLCKLGQTQAAKQVGARLLSHAKGSPWYQSVADSCAGQ